MSSQLTLGLLITAKNQTDQAFAQVKQGAESVNKAFEQGTKPIEAWGNAQQKAAQRMEATHEAALQMNGSLTKTNDAAQIFAGKLGAAGNVAQSTAKSLGLTSNALDLVGPATELASVGMSALTKSAAGFNMASIGVVGAGLAIGMTLGKLALEYKDLIPGMNSVVKGADAMAKAFYGSGLNAKGSVDGLKQFSAEIAAINAAAVKTQIAAQGGIGAMTERAIKAAAVKDKIAEANKITPGAQVKDEAGADAVLKVKAAREAAIESQKKAQDGMQAYMEKSEAEITKFLKGQLDYQVAQVQAAYQEREDAELGVAEAAKEGLAAMFAQQDAAFKGTQIEVSGLEMKVALARQTIADKKEELQAQLQVNDALYQSGAISRAAYEQARSGIKQHLDDLNGVVSKTQKWMDRLGRIANLMSGLGNMIGGKAGGALNAAADAASLYSSGQMGGKASLAVGAAGAASALMGPDSKVGAGLGGAASGAKMGAQSGTGVAGIAIGAIVGFAVGYLKKKKELMIRAAKEAGVSIDKALQDMLSGKGVKKADVLKFLPALLKDKKTSLEMFSKLGADFENLQAQYKAAVLDRTKAGVSGLAAMVAYVGKGSGDTKAAMERMGSYAMGLFGSLRKQGMGFVEAVREMQPALDAITAKAAETGQPATGGAADLVNFSNIIQANQELVGATEGVAAVISGLRVSGSLTAETFKSLQVDVGGYIKDLEATGLTATQALAVAAPSLYQLKKASEDLGLQLDEQTKSQIAAAEAAGLFEGLEDPIDQMVAAMNVMVEVMSAIAQKFGATLPDAVQKYIASLNQIPGNVNTNVNLTQTGGVPGGPPEGTPGTGGGGQGPGFAGGGIVMPRGSVLPWRYAARGIVVPSRPNRGTPVIMGEGGSAEVAAPVKQLFGALGDMMASKNVAALAGLIANRDARPMKIVLGQREVGEALYQETRTGNMRVSDASVVTNSRKRRG